MAPICSIVHGDIFFHDLLKRKWNI